jgi:hypothetical protein
MNGTHLDPASRSIWVDIYQVGSSVRFPRRTPDGMAVKRVDITPDFVASMLDSFARLTAAGDRVTVLKEHDIDGEHYGTVHELRVKDGWMQARLSFVPSLWAAYDDERVVEFSPAFAEVLSDPHTGEQFRNVLLEVTVTAMALQHTLRPPQQTNPGSALAALVASGALIIGAAEMPEDEEKEEEVAPAEEEETPEEAPAEEEDEEKAALIARVADLEARLSAMEQAAAASAANVASLESEVIRRDLLAAGVSAEHHAHLIELHRANRPLFEATARALGSDAQTPIGVVGSAPVGEHLTASQALTEAATKGVTYGKGLAEWAAANHPNLRAEIIALARNKD